MLKYLIMFNKLFNNLPYYLAASLSVLYMELVLALRSDFSMDTYMLAGVVFCAFSFGAVIHILSSMFGNPKVNGWIWFGLTEAITIFFLIEFFCNQTYNTFMNLNAVTNGAGNVMTEYLPIVLSVIKNGIFNIILFHVPSVILLVLCIKKKIGLSRNLWGSAVALILCVVMYFSSEAAMTFKEFAQEKYTYNYMYNDAVQAFGLAHGTWLDIKYAVRGVPDPPLDTDAPVNNADDGVERNQLPMAWENIKASTDDPTMQKVFELIKNQKGSSKNEYTGLFEGKNLVLLTVESMSKEMIKEDLFPLMYRMMTKGIVFEDYYVPSWGGSTSTGETAILTGIVPMYNLDTIQMTIGHDNSYTMASQLSKLGYYTAAYHNGLPNYYNRSVTHPGLGFSKFDANDSAMDNYLNYSVPPSDAEMLRYIADDIEGQSKFFIYAMTYSGHGNYSFDWRANQMCAKNRDLLLGTEYYDDDFVGGYLACSMELELGLQEFVKVLEERGQLDDTVFVLSSDHYPYFLQEPVAWGGEDYTKYLYGYQYTNCFERDHSALIIWTPGLEEYDEPITVSEPTTQIDILPTLLNLFGIDFDSRIFAGRDVFSDAPAIAMWADSSWITPEGSYLASTGEFKLKEGSGVSDEDAYFNQIQSLVRNKIFLSRNFITGDIWSYLSPYVIDGDSDISIVLTEVATDEQLKEILQTVVTKMSRFKPKE